MIDIIGYIVIIGLLIGLVVSFFTGIEGRFGEGAATLFVFLVVVIVAILIHKKVKEHDNDIYRHIGNILDTKPEKLDETEPDNPYPLIQFRGSPNQYIGWGRIGNNNSMIFHHPDCHYARRINHEKVEWFYNPSEAIIKGFKACTICEPLSAVTMFAIGRTAYKTYGYFMQQDNISIDD